MPDPTSFLQQAVALAYANIEKGGRPFGAVLVHHGAVIATGVNTIIATNDPTAHAEMNAIRAAAHALQSPRLAGSTVYASGQPCPMCMAAMRMAGVERVIYACSNADGEPFGLSTAAISADLARPFAEQSMAITHHPLEEEADHALYRTWQARQS